jgi:outer membrane protein assembly factor BamB
MSPRRIIVLERPKGDSPIFVDTKIGTFPYPILLLCMVLIPVIGANCWGQDLDRNKQRESRGQTREKHRENLEQFEPALKQLQPGPKQALPAQKQPPPAKAVAPKKSEPKEDLADDVFLPPDRRTLQRFFQAREFIAKGRYSEAVQHLGAILGAPEDFFFQPEPNQPIHRSLRIEAQRLIGRMPEEGRELYELQYGVRARQLLDEAAVSGNAQGLADVSRQYFHTQAGYEATFLLGLYNLDHGRPLDAALTLRRLVDCPEVFDKLEPALTLAMATGWIESGSTDKAREVIAKFLRYHSPASLKINYQEAPQFSGADDAVDWLTKLAGTSHVSQQTGSDNWLMFRGDPQRNAKTKGGTPLMNLCWRIPAADDPLIEEVVDQARQFYLERGIASTPGFHPLVVDDVVLLRTYKNLLAADFISGKRLWEVPADDSLENRSPGDADINPQLSVAAGLTPQRAWGDTTFGMLSSDGRLVFCIEDANQASVARPARRAINTNQPFIIKIFNRLAAYDVRTGKLKWQLGGDADQFAVRLPETFFLGPPLPLMGQLYVLAEMKGEIRLLALDASNGKVLWSQQLAMVEQSMQQDSYRRLAAISPSYADGILICPSSTGALVAVELATRSLLWGYCYSRDNQSDQYIERYPDFVQANANFSDSAICVAEGCILVTPADSDFLHCLNLIDGELRWKHKLQDDLYIACVHQGNVILIGARQAQAIRLADGNPGWKGRVISLPEGAMPSGRGFLSGDRYFLPLSSAEVAMIDVSQGKIIHTAKSRKGFVPGNLICYKGRIISQSYDGVDVFYQLDAAKEEIGRRLAADPADSDALCLQGEIFLDENKRTEAIDCFRRALAGQDDPSSRPPKGDSPIFVDTKIGTVPRELLRDTLLDGLKQEFAVYREKTAEIERLLDDPSQQAAYFRLMAVGLQQSGDLLAAFDYCQRLTELEADKLPLDAVSMSLSVRRDRWVQAQLASLRTEAKGETAEKIDGVLRNRFQAAMASGSIEALQRFINYFGNQPIAAEARAELVRKLSESRRLIDAELALCQSYPSSDPASNVPALDKLAELFRQSGQNESAALSYNWLRRRFSGAIIRDGKTISELIDELPRDDAVNELLGRKDQWPVGDVETASADTKNVPVNNYSRFSLEFKGMAGPYFDGLNLAYDQNRRMLLCADSLGNSIWQLPLYNDRSQQQQLFNREAVRARALGHLLFVSVGNNLFAIDTLRPKEKNTPKILWSQAVGEASANAVGMNQIFIQAGVIQMRGMPGMYNVNNELELATARYVCVLRSHVLTALDPLTGAALWARQDIPQGSVIWGDDEYVFVLPPDKPEAMVLRALNGETLGTRKIPRVETHTAYRGRDPVKTYSPLNETCPLISGRNLLFWRVENNRRVLEMFDPWAQKSVWPKCDYSIGAQYSLLQNELIGIMEPGGDFTNFTLLNLADGRSIAQVKLKPEQNMVQATVIAFEDHYLALTYNSFQSNVPQIRSIQQMMGVPSKQILQGRLYAIDKEGKLMWPEPVEIKDQQYPMNQPSGWPVIVFASQIYEQKPNVSPRNQLSILAVDKRSGRTVYSGAYSNQGVINIAANAEKKTVDLLMSRKTVTLTFTDKPPRPKDKSTEEKKMDLPKESSPRALLKSLEKSIDQYFRLPADDESNDAG